MDTSLSSACCSGEGTLGACEGSSGQDTGCETTPVNMQPSNAPIYSILGAEVIRGLKLAANLLTYPKSQEVALDQARELAALSKNPSLQAFAERVAECDDGKLDERYAQTFEIGAEACLYAGFHIFGLAYKRGVFLVSLKEAMDQEGVGNRANEVPDHLALILDLAAAYFVRREEEGRGDALIQECVLPVTERLGETLVESAQGYGLLMRGLDEWLKERWAPVVWQLVEEDNDAHFLA